MTEQPTVNSSTRQFAGVDTESQNCAQPPLNAFAAMADSGSSTSRLSQMTETPNPRPDVRPSRCPAVAVTRPAGRVRAAVPSPGGTGSCA